jgi:hypothetical protein
LFAAYLGTCALMVCWPGYEWFGNSIEPYVSGLPFSLAWNVGWVVATFLVLLVYHVTGEDVDGSH